MNAAIIGTGTALPPHAYTQGGLLKEFDKLFGNTLLAAKVFSNPGLHTRHFVLSPHELKEYHDGAWSSGKRNEIFRERAVPLAAQALQHCLEDADLPPEQVDCLVQVTCTGCITPGPDILLAKTLGMRHDLKRTVINGMGCYAAFPALQCALEKLSLSFQTVVVVCVELCSLHFQPVADTDNVVSSSLFADGAAAVALSRTRPGILSVIGTHSWTDYDTDGDMTWILGDHGFRMTIAASVPDFIGAHVRDFAGELLTCHGLRVEDVAHWAIHPGGPRILQEVQGALSLTQAQMEPSRAVLRECGNMSSATILFILERIRRECAPRKGESLMMLGFGPGLTCEACLARWN